MKIVAFKVGKPKQFNYKPLFYNKEKEEMQERLKKYSEPEQIEAERLRSKIKETWRLKDTRNHQLSKRTLYIYLAGAILLIYFIFFR
jgi:predicted transcriptional regulator